MNTLKLLYAQKQDQTSHRNTTINCKPNEVHEVSFGYWWAAKGFGYWGGGGGGGGVRVYTDEFHYLTPVLPVMYS